MIPKKLKTYFSSTFVFAFLVVVAAFGCTPKSQPKKQTANPNASKEESKSMEIVSQSAIDRQKSKVTVDKLSNGISYIHYAVPESDLYSVQLTVGSGYSSQPKDQKAIGELMWSVGGKGSKDFPREKLRQWKEKYSIETGCGEAVEQSTCALTGATDFWQEGLDVFSDVVLNPAFDPKDFDLEKKQMVAAIESTPQDPEGYVNDVVNKIFYPKDHLFYSDYEQRLEQLKTLDIKSLQEYHKKVVHAGNLQITYVGNLSSGDVKLALEKKFGGLGAGQAQAREVPAPAFDAKNYYAFEHRDLPNAYIRIKTNSPGRDTLDSMRASFAMSILSDKLWDVLRTKRSLTYSVHAYSIPFTTGLAVMSVSTAKPKESIEAMDEVISEFKSKVLSKAEVDEYKPKFATTYFMRQETNGSIAGTIASNYFYHKNLDRVFDYPTILGSITPEDVHRLANEILKNFRVGVIYHKDKMKREWVDSFVKKHM